MSSGTCGMVLSSNGTTPATHTRVGGGFQRPFGYCGRNHSTNAAAPAALSGKAGDGFIDSCGSTASKLPMFISSRIWKAVPASAVLTERSSVPSTLKRALGSGPAHS